MDATVEEALIRWQEEGNHQDKDILSMLISMDQAVVERKRVLKDHIPAYMVEGSR